MQALSNSIWALAHMRSKPAELDIIAGIPGLTMHFMFGISECASNMLKGLRTCSDFSHMQASMQQAEKKFSCQVSHNPALMKPPASSSPSGQELVASCV
jgi:hypothetical protein